MRGGGWPDWAGWELRRRLVAPTSLLGLGVGVAFITLGQVQLGGVHTVFSDAFLAGLVLGLNSAASDDAKRGWESFAVRNVITPTGYVLAKFTVMVVWLAVYAGIMAGTAIALAGNGPALHDAIVGVTLAGSLLLPLVFAVEVVASTRLPAALALLLFLMALLTLVGFGIEPEGPLAVVGVGEGFTAAERAVRSLPAAALLSTATLGVTILVVTRRSSLPRPRRLGHSPTSEG